ncbi:hypothetical protein KEM55_009372, partial [Ascosphaera atra]
MNQQAMNQPPRSASRASTRRDDRTRPDDSELEDAAIESTAQHKNGSRSKVRTEDRRQACNDDEEDVPAVRHQSRIKEGRATIRNEGDHPSHRRPCPPSTPRNPRQSQQLSTRQQEENINSNNDDSEQTMATVTQIASTPVQTPARSIKGHNLRSLSRKNYSADDPDMPATVFIDLDSHAYPNYQATASLATTGIVGAIVVFTWEKDYNRGITWSKQNRSFHKSTQKAAIAAHAASTPADRPCEHCAKGNGIFTTCSVNSLWPSNGACTSCGYWGRAWQCPLVDSTDRVSPTKRSVNIEKVIKELAENTAHGRET